MLTLGWPPGLFGMMFATKIVHINHRKNQEAEINWEKNNTITNNSTRGNYEHLGLFFMCACMCAYVRERHYRKVVQGKHSGMRQSWVPIPAISHPSRSRDNCSIHFIRLWLIKLIKHLVQCLAQRKHSSYYSYYKYIYILENWDYPIHPALGYSTHFINIIRWDSGFYIQISTKRIG